ncbi:cytidylyltransferase domain-containing protein [Fibrobacterota bacterium]
MRSVAIIQARMGSNRLPGKVLSRLNGKPMLTYLIERAQKSRLIEEIAVATSEKAENDGIASLCRELGVDCFRGSEHNVASRFYTILKEKNSACFVRICADSPLLDPILLDRAVTRLREKKCDLATNIFPRTFPAGQSVEAMQTRAFVDAFSDFTTPDDFEHVTRFFYRNASRFAISNFKCEGDFSQVKFCIDTAADFNKMKALMKKMGKDHLNYGYKDLIRFWSMDSLKAA